MNLTQFLESTRTEIETALTQTFSTASSSGLRSAIHFSLLNGGKRLRPALVRAAADAAGAEPGHWLTPAMAVEMIHVYSLIHDDLPAMDDDDLRHGRASNHKQFNEATAILAGDALQAEAFSLITRNTQFSDHQVRRMTNRLSEAAGAGGMVGGQMIDLESENSTLTLEQLENLHALKTGALIRSALSLGALSSASITKELEMALDSYGAALGLAFQITDDILDVTSSTEVLGKPQGSDVAAQKSTYVSLLGLDGAKQMASVQHQRAQNALAELGLNKDAMLWQLADYVLNRKY